MEKKQHKSRNVTKATWSFPQDVSKISCISAPDWLWWLGTITRYAMDVHHNNREKDW
jgi:hypothetical protein